MKIAKILPNDLDAPLLLRANKIVMSMRTAIVAAPIPINFPGRNPLLISRNNNTADTTVCTAGIAHLKTFSTSILLSLLIQTLSLDQLCEYAALLDQRYFLTRFHRQGEIRDQRIS